MLLYEGIIAREKFNYAGESIVFLTGVRTIAPEENNPLVKVRVWVRVKFRIRVRGQFSSWAIVLESITCFLEASASNN